VRRGEACEEMGRGQGGVGTVSQRMAESSRVLLMVVSCITDSVVGTLLLNPDRQGSRLQT
jgi:hypothetical protein